MGRFELSQVADLLRAQDGVVARAQLLARGAVAHDVKRLLRRRELASAWPGILVAHTGPLTPRQRQWVAVLSAWPAALTGVSALPGLHHGPTRLVVGPGRQPRLPPGTRVRRSDHLDAEVQWHRAPPRVSIEHALIDAASERIGATDVPGAFAVLAEGVSARRTTVDRVLRALDDRPRVAGRRLIRDMLGDLAVGACSVLEREYLRAVERAHGLPRAERQHASLATGRLTLKDVRYRGLIVELDGRGFHLGERADEDAFRDLAELAVTATSTIRLTYGLVFHRPCRTAFLLAEVLRGRGWRGSIRRCRRCPTDGTADVVRSRSTP